MMRGNVRLAILGVTLVACALVACSDSTTPHPSPPPVFKSLTTRSDVLFNTQLAYNKRDITQYEKLLDDNFTFFPTPGDVKGGLPDHWERAEKVLYNSRLFDENYPGPHRCKKIDMDLAFETGVTWTATAAPPAFSGETWYSTTVYYDFNIDVEPDTQYQPNAGSSMEITARNAGSSDAPQWRLVEMRDLTPPPPLAAQAVPTAAVIPATLGKIKSLYQ
jgi:hypothetical protein